MENKLIKLTKLAKDLEVTKATLYNWKKKGVLEFIKSNTNRNFVTIETYNNLLGIKENKEQKIVIYSRVSSTVNKKNLEDQSERLYRYCLAKGYRVHKNIKEFGSGINDKRSKLEKLLTEQDFTKIVVEHKDRLTRFGFNYIEKLLNKNNIEIEVVNNAENDKEDIIQDFVSIITSYCARIYGKRRSKRKTEKLIQDLEKDIDQK